MDARYNLKAERQHAAERRETVLRAATAEFAAKGLHGASTERIAHEAGIAHSYVFKLFGTKKGLFLAATERVYDTIMELFRTGVRAHPDEPLIGMGASFRRLLAQREELLLVFHGYAAAGDPEIGALVRARYVALYHYAREATGANPTQLHAFWAQGMLLVVATAIDLHSLAGTEEWIPGLFNGMNIQPPLPPAPEAEQTSLAHQPDHGVD